MHWFSIIFDFIFYFINLNWSLCIISLFIVKYKNHFLYFTFSINFMFLKMKQKFLKNYFSNLKYLYSNVWNNRLWWFLWRFSNKFGSIFHFPHLNYSLYTISILGIKYKNLFFVFYFFNKFYVFENESKVC